MLLYRITTHKAVHTTSWRAAESLKLLPHAPRLQSRWAQYRLGNHDLSEDISYQIHVRVDDRQERRIEDAF